MRADPLLLRLAIVLGVSNFLATATITVQVLFAQEVLGLSSGAFGLLACLYGSIATWGIGYVLVGLSTHGVVVAVALFGVMVAAMLWNVITMSWRQRRIPGLLLGRVDSMCCFTRLLAALPGPASARRANAGLREAA